MTRHFVALSFAAAAALSAACAGLRIGDPDRFQPVALNRVFPYPSDAELADQKISVVLATQYTKELPKAKVAAAMKPVLATLDGYLTEAGAGVTDRSSRALSSVRREVDAKRGPSRADWVIVARIDKFRHWSEYSEPTSLFKNEAELAEEPGRCKHHGEVGVLLRAYAVPTDDTPRATYRLDHSDLFEEEEFDESCPIEPARELGFLEDVVAEALPCLEAAIKNGFAPLGYVEEHRRRGESGLDIYRTSLGSRNGAVPGLELKIYRVQYMTTRDGRRVRDERLIGEGVLSDQIGPSHSWMVVDLGDLEQPMLAGDLVRAVYEDPESFVLGRGLCEKALTAQGTP